MTRQPACLAALLALAACGGTDPQPEPYRPPVVDPARLGIACPAPEVMITTDEYGGQTAAGDLQVGDFVYSRPTWGGSSDYYEVTEATRLTGQQRVRLVVCGILGECAEQDLRSTIFTPDHALRLAQYCSSVPLPEELDTRWIQVQHVLPGWCVDGQKYGRVVRVENAPDGDVIRLSVGDDVGHAYVADWLFSLAHNADVGPVVP